jgi:hypothetical protein
MKRQLILLAGIAMILFAACKKQVGNIVTRGDWKVSSYIEQGNDETTDFSNYIFSFENNGTVTLTGNTGIFTGTWSEGDEGSKHKLYINFMSGPAAVLTNDWEIINKSRRELRMTTENLSSGSSETLVFTKR